MSACVHVIYGVGRCEHEALHGAAYCALHRGYVPNDPVPGAVGSPEWPCLCGARNRLRDLVCRNCGADKP